MKVPAIFAELILSRSMTMPNRNDGSNPNYLPIPPHCAPPSCPDQWRLTGICPDCADSLQARVAELEAALLGLVRATNEVVRYEHEGMEPVAEAMGNAYAVLK